MWSTPVKPSSISGKAASQFVHHTCLLQPSRIAAETAQRWLCRARDDGEFLFCSVRLCDASTSSHFNFIKAASANSNVARSQSYARIHRQSRNS